MGMSDQLINYYKVRFGDGIDFDYDNYHFNLRLNIIRCYPQDFAALLTYNPKDKENSVKAYPSYFGIDIGGWTVDIISILSGKVNSSQNDSKPLGVLAMYDSITKSIESAGGERYNSNDIQDLLDGKKTLIPLEDQITIKSKVQAWYDDIINSMAESDVNLKKYPVIFMGGGSLLFKEYIKNDVGKRLSKVEFLYNTNANAAAYSTLIAREAAKQQ
jgi:plasmid segregation protein ParM